MSIISALYAGASGMAAMDKSMQVIGNNIANINTIGFKASRIEFADLLTQSISTPSGQQQLGRGVRTEAIQGLFHQGAFVSTPVVTDMAINGNGFFVLTEGNDLFFTRAGQFRVDKDGILTNSLGMNVDGYLFDAAGQPTGARGPINLSAVTAPPNPTGDGVAAGSGVMLNLLLDSTTPTLATGFVITDPTGTSHYSTAVTVYDSLGADHMVMLYFTKTADNTWEWNAVVSEAEVTESPPPDYVLGATGTLTFDAFGEEVTFTTDSAPGFNFTGGAQIPQVIGFDFAGTTQVASTSLTNSITQDGFAAGALQSIDIDRDGVITGMFTNGRARTLAQLTIASFAAETALVRLGNSLFGASQKSGQPIFGTANEGTNGQIAASTLELSNIDLTTEFINLITNQRAFQANTKIITVGDQMLESVIQMKR